MFEGHFASFRLFFLFKNILAEKQISADLNSDRRSGRKERWPLGTPAPRAIVKILKVTLANAGHGCGQVVSVLAFYLDDPSSDPSEVNNFVM